MSMSLASWQAVRMPLASWQAIKAVEGNLDWEKAAELWDAAGEPLFGDACRLIIKANERGDKFRELVREKLKADGLPTEGWGINIPLCKRYMDILRSADQEVYGVPA